VPLEPDDVTIAEVLKSAGYATGIVGKWGLGEPDSTGVPNRQGFDYWFGYLNQHHAHNYYPEYLWRNEKKMLLPNVEQDNVASKRVVYSADLFTEEAVAFLEQKRTEPFFLYLAQTLPHANNEAIKHGMEVPSDAPYTKEEWPQPEKNKAAMIATTISRFCPRTFKVAPQNSLRQSRQKPHLASTIMTRSCSIPLAPLASAMGKAEIQTAFATIPPA
jgi:arylsulfatase A-like enzyme